MQGGKSLGLVWFDAASSKASTMMLDGIEQLLSAADLQKEELEGICLTLGPGSFTGLRVGLATAEGLAQAFEIPLYGVSTLEVMAATLPHFKGRVHAIQNAYKGELYTGTYDLSSGLPTQLGELQMIKPEVFFEQVKEGDIVIGNGLAILKKKGLDLTTKNALEDNSWGRGSNGIGVIELCVNKEIAPASAQNLEPIYIRASEAEVNYGDNFKSR